jgi:voltage-gated potassium channel Kch
MLVNFLAGLPVLIVCLLFQGIFVALCLQQYAHYQHRREEQPLHVTPLRDMLLLSIVMLLLLLGNFVQMAVWAALFVLLGEFAQFSDALYFSGVTFATLGYGDMLLSPAWRLLSALEAANGILMFGVSTAVMSAAVNDVFKRYIAKLKQQ